MWISLPGSRRGWARGVSGPSFVPVGSNPWLNPWLLEDARGWLVRACGRGPRRGPPNAVYSRAESRVSSAAPCCFIHWATFLNFSRRRGSGWTFAASWYSERLRSSPNFFACFVPVQAPAPFQYLSCELSQLTITPSNSLATSCVMLSLPFVGGGRSPHFGPRPGWLLLYLLILQTIMPRVEGG